MDFDFLLVISRMGPVLYGAGVTVIIAFFSCTLGLIVGTAVFLMKQSTFTVVRTIVRLYSSFIRGTPALVQILVFYYALAPLTGLDVGPLTAGIMALGFNSGAYVAEILRGGFSRVTGGQLDAAKALGLHRVTIWRKIILPQVFYSVLPPLANEFTMVIKLTPLLAVIAVLELTRSSQHLVAETYRPVEVWTLTAALYFIICFSLSKYIDYLQRVTAKFRM